MQQPTDKTPKLRKYLVGFFFDTGGTGRAIIDASDMPVTSRLVLKIENYLVTQGMVKPSVFSVQPLELVEEGT